jgi:hypothetical protein
MERTLVCVQCGSCDGRDHGTENRAFAALSFVCRPCDEHE